MITLPGSAFDPMNGNWHVFVVRKAGSVIVCERTCGSERAGWDRCARLSQRGLVAYCSDKFPANVEWFY